MKTMMLLCSLISAVPAAALEGKVIGMKSGSHLEILKDGKTFALKLHGVECPARTFAAGRTARRYVADRAFLMDVRIDIAGAQPDGTLLGDVTLPNGMNLGAELVRNGLAWWDNRANPRDLGLAGLEKRAREACLGIWAESAEEDEGQDFGKDVLVRRELADRR